MLEQSHQCAQQHDFNVRNHESIGPRQRLSLDGVTAEHVRPAVYTVAILIPVPVHGYIARHRPCCTVHILKSCDLLNCRFFSLLIF